MRGWPQLHLRPIFRNDFVVTPKARLTSENKAWVHRRFFPSDSIYNVKNCQNRICPDACS